MKCQQCCDCNIEFYYYVNVYGIYIYIEACTVYAYIIFTFVVAVAVKIIGRLFSRVEKNSSGRNR